MRICTRNSALIQPRTSLRKSDVVVVGPVAERVRVDDVLDRVQDKCEDLKAALDEFPHPPRVVGLDFAKKEGSSF